MSKLFFGLMSVLLLALHSSSLQAGPEAAASQLKERIFHGTLQVEVNESGQATFVLDRSHSERSPEDGYADLVMRFAPLEDEPLPAPLLEANTPLHRVTIEKLPDGFTLVTKKGERFRFLVPQRVAEIAELRQESADPVIPGYGLSWQDVHGRSMTPAAAVTEFNNQSVLNCQNKGGPKGDVEASSVDCTNGGMGATACMVSCPLGMSCSVSCSVELGYYACCSCYTGCGCRSYDHDISPY